MGNATQKKRGTHGRSDRRWKELSARLRATLPPICWICGQGIDLTLHHTHRMSFTLDHVVPLDLPGTDPYDESNILPAHRSCNSSRGAKFGNARRAGTTGLETLPADVEPPRFTRRW